MAVGTTPEETLANGGAEMKVPKGAEWMFRRSMNKTIERRKRQKRFREVPKIPPETMETLRNIGNTVEGALREALKNGS